jgi:hypothetical protein
VSRCLADERPDLASDDQGLHGDVNQRGSTALQTLLRSRRVSPT